MKRARGQAAALSLRGVFTAFALVAFVLQSLAVQTHIHIAGPSEAAFDAQQSASPGAKAATSRDRDRHPAPTDDAAHCPLCQEFLAAGAYLTPAPVFLPLPLLTAAVAPSFVPSPAVIRATTHGWLSRAPPLA
ncbi:MAG: DUF2946 family protein [Rhizomicrobium sp.]